MERIPIVNAEESKLAKELEMKLIGLHRSSGILFVGVSVTPHFDEEPIYLVWVGCSREIDPRTIPPLVEAALREYVEMGLKLKVEAHQGISRSMSLLG